MPSATSAQDLQSFLESLLSSRERTASFFLPFFAGLSIASPSQELEPEDDGGRPDQPDRFILINPFTQSMVVIERSDSQPVFDSFLDDLFSEKRGRPPASKASIDAMKTVEISDCEAGCDQCVICLEDWEVEEKAKEMPCRHKFHGECIEKWLKIHGSCPVCRYEMPVDEGEGEKKRSGGGDGARRRDVWLSFMVTSDGREESTHQDQAMEG